MEIIAYVLMTILCVVFVLFLYVGIKETIRLSKEQREAEKEFSRLCDCIAGCNSMATWEHWSYRVEDFKKKYGKFLASIIHLQEILIKKALQINTKLSQ